MTDHSLATECPVCRTPAGEPCHTREGFRATASHRLRRELSPESRAGNVLDLAVTLDDPAALREAALSYVEALMRPRGVYMVHANSAGSVFVKTLTFFASQGGFSQEWGRRWTPVVATDPESARREGCRTLPLARPYERQAIVALRAVEVDQTPG